MERKGKKLKEKIFARAGENGTGNGRIGRGKRGEREWMESAKKER